MTNRRSNDVYMTGVERRVGTSYPWDAMKVGDYFVASCSAAVVATIRNKKGSEQFRAVLKDGRNIVVRVE